MLLKVVMKIFTNAFRRLIVELPPDKRQKYRETFQEFIIDLTAAAAEGAARGTVEGMKDAE